MDKKIKVNVDNKILVFTVVEVVRLTQVHLVFKDKFGHQRGFRLQDIVEILKTDCVEEDVEYGKYR